ncbi:MAG: GspH/FimT family pseudopilin, partial [Halofilum sp. (in: g-proteobacteria)]|nr:GspH/FimT family pseudopilin [Halofilum sp. (in: g-proteobacteria)]
SPPLGELPLFRACERARHVTMKRNHGFTLIELMITLIVMGVVIFIAVPNFASLMRNVWASGRTNEFVSAFNIARSEAITRSNTVTVCASDDPMAANPDCSGDGAGWANGWIVFADDDNDQVVDGGETVIQVWEGLEDGIALTEANSRAAVVYGSRGSASQAMDFDLEPTTDCTGNSSRNITITPVGRAEVTEQAC